MIFRSLFITTCLSLVIAVALGAFGAHALEQVLSTTELETWKTASQYHFIHSVGALSLLAIYRSYASIWARSAITLLLTGILLFSGSLYLLATQDTLGLSLGWLGPVTPLGGACFIAGWICAAFSIKDIKHE